MPAAGFGVDSGGLFEPIYAGFWKRFAAALIDSVVLGVGGFVAGFIWGVVAVEALGIYDMATIEFGGQIAGIFVGWVYCATMESGPKSATLGKMALGIKVTDLHGERISLGRASGRHFAKFLSALIFGIGYLMVAFTEKKQGLHDSISGCLVVNK